LTLLIEVFYNNAATTAWQEEKGMTEDEMVGWHYGLHEHGFE